MEESKRISEEEKKGREQNYIRGREEGNKRDIRGRREENKRDIRGREEGKRTKDIREREEQTHVMKEDGETKGKKPRKLLEEEGNVKWQRESSS